MIINKRLIGTISESKKYIAGNVVLQWCSLVANMVIMTSITSLLALLFIGKGDTGTMVTTFIVVVIAVVIRFVCSTGASRMGYLSAKEVKKTLRAKIYEKLLSLGVSYKEAVKTSEVVQVAVEGVDQLEIYFGSYLPQFFYAMLAPLTLFTYLSFINVPSAIVLLVCVPLIPISIAAVQTIAKKILSKYWGKYTALGDTFLENLQGLTTLKIYQADEFKNEEMNAEAEKFRKVTMKVLTMQLNSIILMDLIAYGGAALGIIMAVTQYAKGNVTLAGCMLIILLSAEFFIPMRQLGSFFHIAMNGMAAGDKIFKLLDVPENEIKSNTRDKSQAYSTKIESGSKIGTITCRDLHFSYEKDQEVLHGIHLSFPQESFTAIVGESGCGKSTIASILMGRNKDYSGLVSIGKTELKSIPESSLMNNITYISNQSYLFKGTVRYNLLMGNPEAGDKELWSVLERVNLSGFLKNENGLDTLLLEKAENLSGGQCQRLALARALLHDSPVYIFDEATSNIDVESENDIMKEVHALAESKTVILISHRLANVVHADNIYVLEDGSVAEEGNHKELLENHGLYKKMWNTQQDLENYGKDRNEYEKTKRF
ncbi:MAG: ABC transporter ATP-binding protein/permease [Ruminococcus sp.]|jgi:ATP-binding cassette subfamily C protein|nr:ABC transporter ATP-binding protein/permease [Ruminococcus sp.]